MRKTIIASLLLAIPFTKSFTQIHWGAKAGLNLAQIQNFKFSEHDNMKVALNGGLLAQFKVSNKFFFQTELLYSDKGFKFSGMFPNAEGELSLNYLSVPMLAGFRLSDKFSFVLGPETSYLLNAKTTVDGKHQNNTITYDRLDVALNFGMMLKIGRRLALDCRYSHGFQTLDGAVVSHPSIEYIGIQKGSNEILQLDVVYFFKIK